MFLLGARSAQRRGVSFALCALMPAVREVFELSGFTRIIPVYADRAAALDAARAGTGVTEERASVPGDAAQLPVLTGFLQRFWAANGLPAAQALTFELALEEVFMNVVMHGSHHCTAGARRGHPRASGRQPDDDRPGRRA